MDRKPRQSSFVIRALSLPLTDSSLVSLLGDAFLVCLGAGFLLALSRITVVLPFSPVPVTGQTLAVLLLGLTLGSRRGLASVLTYIGLGISGLPVFALGTGPAYLLGPTGGYLAGFALAAWLSGFIRERLTAEGAESADEDLIHDVAGTTLALLVGTAAIYACGLPWLARFTGWSRMLSLGFYPFIPGDVCKLVIAGTVTLAGHRLTRPRR